MSNNKIIDLYHSKIFYRADGILQVDFADNCMLDVVECKELISSYTLILGTNKVPILHVFGKYTNATKEARDFSVSPQGLKHSLVEAYVLTSLAQRLLLNFYIKFNKPSVPTKYFTSKNEAVIWLLTYIK